MLNSRVIEYPLEETAQMNQPSHPPKSKVSKCSVSTSFDMKVQLALLLQHAALLFNQALRQSQTRWMLGEVKHSWTQRQPLPLILLGPLMVKTENIKSENHWNSIQTSQKHYKPSSLSPRRNPNREVWHETFTWNLVQNLWRTWFFPQDSLLHPFIGTYMEPLTGTFYPFAWTCFWNLI